MRWKLHEDDPGSMIECIFFQKKIWRSTQHLHPKLTNKSFLYWASLMSKWATMWGMMYVPTKWGAKELQNPQNHRVEKTLEMWWTLPWNCRQIRPTSRELHQSWTASYSFTWVWGPGWPKFNVVTFHQGPLQYTPENYITNVPWKGTILKGNIIFQPSNFRRYVCFQGVMNLSLPRGHEDDVYPPPVDVTIFVDQIVWIWWIHISKKY